MNRLADSCVIQPYGIRKVVGALNADEDAYWPAVIRRTYFEHRTLSNFIRAQLGGNSVKSGVEFGCGYGRMLPVLSEFAEEVVGIERDAELAAIAGSLSPRFDIREVRSFANVAQVVDDGSAGLILSYTVLQHLAEDECRAAITQMKRVLTPQGLIVICEDTGSIIGSDYYQRTMDQYQDLFQMKMTGHTLRRFEDGRVVGQHMAFRWP